MGNERYLNIEIVDMTCGISASVWRSNNEDHIPGI